MKSKEVKRADVQVAPIEKAPLLDEEAENEFDEGAFEGLESLS